MDQASNVQYLSKKFDILFCSITHANLGKFLKPGLDLELLFSSPTDQIARKYKNGIMCLWPQISHPKLGQIAHVGGALKTSGPADSKLIILIKL